MDKKPGRLWCIGLQSRTQLKPLSTAHGTHNHKSGKIRIKVTEQLQCEFNTNPSQLQEE